MPSAVRGRGKETEKVVEGYSEKKCQCYGRNGSSYISERQTHYSARVIRKCDMSSLLKASLKLPSTYIKTDNRVIRDGAYNLSSMVLNFLQLI